MFLQWEENSEKCMEQGTMLLDALLQGTAVQSQGSEILPPEDCIQKGYEQMEKGFDKEKGGFGKAPKFPQPGSQFIKMKSFKIII